MSPRRALVHVEVTPDPAYLDGALDVVPEVWEEALRLAEGDPRRIRVVSEVEVRVENSPRVNGEAS